MRCSGLDWLDDGWPIPDKVPGAVQVKEGARPSGAWSEVWQLPARVLQGLRREDEPVVWRFIEENYLLRYGGLVRVDFDWMAEGLWDIPFPGSVRMGLAPSPEYFGM